MILRIADEKPGPLKAVAVLVWDLDKFEKIHPGDIRVMASYSLRVSCGPWERIPALSSAKLFQAQLEMLPRRCTEAWGFPELSELSSVLLCLPKHNQAQRRDPKELPARGICARGPSPAGIWTWEHQVSLLP